MKKKLSLKREASFQYVRRHGTKINGKLLRLFVLKAATTKVGITASKKVGNAVKRNLVKRRIRVIFDSNMNQLLKPRHYIVTAQIGAAEATFSELKAELEALFVKGGVVLKNDGEAKC